MNTESKYKLIIIDDHPMIREGVMNFIKKEAAFEFIADFNDARSALNASLTVRPDVIILDLNIDGIDGEKAFPMLKDKFHGCKIIAYTQYVDKEKELEKLGFDGYVLKSERDALITAISEVLAGRKYFKMPGKKLKSVTDKFDEADDFLKFKSLSERETEVAELMVQDFTSKEIGKKMFIAETTVETHRKHIKEKIGVKTKRELYAILKSFLQ